MTWCRGLVPCVVLPWWQPDERDAAFASMPNLTNIHEMSPGSLHGVSTQAIVVSELAAAIATVGQHPRIRKVGDSLIVSVSGFSAVVDASGAAKFDLLDSIPDAALRLSWVDSFADSSRMALAVRKLLGSLEHSPFRGIPEAILNPNVSVLLAGIDKANKVFAARIRVAGTLLGFGSIRTIRFSDPVVEMVIPNPAKFRLLLETRQEGLQSQALNIGAARDPRILKYQGVWSLGQLGSTIDEQKVRHAASDLVQFAMDNDEQIRGPVGVLSVRVP